MCLAVPAKIKTITDLEAEVEVGGTSRVVSLWFTPEAQPGDYVYVHAGFAISIIDETEALASLQVLRELADSYTTEELYWRSGDLPHL